MAQNKELKQTYLYFLKINSYLMENNLIFCFVDGTVVSKADCKLYFDKLFAAKMPTKRENYSYNYSIS